VPRLGDVGEHAWIAALLRRLPPPTRARGVLVGPGDDAAAVRLGARPILLTTDCLVEEVHFRRGWLAPVALGRRAFGASVSDVAAMGASRASRCSRSRPRRICPEPISTAWRADSPRPPRARARASSVATSRADDA
jgi:thiamine-monophosphate kinase